MHVIGGEHLYSVRVPPVWRVTMALCAVCAGTTPWLEDEQANKRRNRQDESASDLLTNREMGLGGVLRPRFD